MTQPSVSRWAAIRAAWPKPRPADAACHAALAAVLAGALFLRVPGIRATRLEQAATARPALSWVDPGPSLAPMQDVGVPIPPDRQPPLTRYGAAAAHLALSWLWEEGSEGLVPWLPLAVFCLWFWTLWRFLEPRHGRGPALAAAALFSCVPAVLESTQRGASPGPALEAWLLFCAFASLSELLGADRSSPRRWLKALPALLALQLSGPSAALVYPVALAVLAAQGRPSRSSLWRAAALLAVPAALAQAACHWLADGYSPVFALREACALLWSYSDPEHAAFFQRPGGLGLDAAALAQTWGWPAAALGLAGAAAAAAEKPGSEARRAAAAGALALAGVCLPPVARSLSAALVPPLAAVGLAALLRPDPLARPAAWLRRRASAWRLPRAAPAPSPALGLAAGAFAVAAFVWLRSAEPKPAVAVSGLDVPLRSGEYRVELSLGNAGGPARRYPGAFAGLHVEVENGSVREVSAASEGAAGRVLFPGDAERGTLTHFQADFGDLGPGRQGRVGFTIAPYREPVRVRYRGWIPGGCVPRAGRRLRLPANRAQAEQDCMRRWPLQDSPAGSRCAAAQPPGGPWLEELACLTAAPAR